jgi:D-alanyl-D-alanine carboxypeptidase
MIRLKNSAWLMWLATIWLASGCNPQSPQPGDKPVDVGVQIAKQFQAELHSLYQQAQTTEENFPGATAAFILPDSRVYAFATGYSDISQQTPMTTELRMPSGSIGKTYVAALALLLAQRGEIDLDQKVSHWLADEDWFARVPNAEQLTLRILLSHTGGLLDHAFASDDFVQWIQASRRAGDRDAFLRPRQVMEFVLDTDALFPAGKGFNYTDTGYILAGITIEKATQRTYYDLLTEHFLQPLGLQYTLPADQRGLPDLAQGYAHESSKFFGTPLEIIEDGLMVMNPVTEWTGGGLVNNPQDLVVWAKLLYEGNAIEGEGELEQLLDIGFITDEDKPSDGYGLGVAIRQTQHGMSYGHGGFYPGYNSRVIYFPDHKIAVAMQINSDKTSVPDHTMSLARIVINGFAGQ